MSDGDALRDVAPFGAGRVAVVITVSDGVAAGIRDDVSGRLLAERLAGFGFDVRRTVVADDRDAIGEAIVGGAGEGVLLVTTGGTGLTPRDVTPQATEAVLDYLVPGMAEMMRSEGRRSTPLAVLSRGVVGVRGRCLVVNTPGSPRATMESLEALLPVLPHALETVAGPFDHDAGPNRAGPSGAGPSGAPAGD